MPKIHELPESRIRKVQDGATEKIEFAFDRNNRFRDRVKAFIKGENELGRGVGMVADVAMVFLPSGIQSGREAVQRIIEKQNKPTMGLKQKKTLLSKTVWSSILIVVIAILNALGVQFVNDPEVMQIIWNVGYSLAAAFGLYGLRDAIDKKRV